MTRAARRLALAQPALSQAMARLETQVGAQLLERHPRGVALTQAGEAFLEKAQATLAAMDDVQATARSWARQQEDRLHIGFMSLTPPMMAGDLFSCFMADHPSATIEWRQLGYPSLSPRDWLGGSDAGLIWFAPTGPGLAVQPIRTSPLVVAMTNTHPLADRSELRVEDVLDETFRVSSTGAIQAGSVIGVSTAIAEPRRGGPRTAPSPPRRSLRLSPPAVPSPRFPRSWRCRSPTSASGRSP